MDTEMTYTIIFARSKLHGGYTCVHSHSGDDPVPEEFQRECALLDASDSSYVAGVGHIVYSSDNYARHYYLVREVP